MKRLLALLLCLTMVGSILSAPALATDDPENTENVTTTASTDDTNSDTDTGSADTSNSPVDADESDNGNIIADTGDNDNDNANTDTDDNAPQEPDDSQNGEADQEPDNDQPTVVATGVYDSPYTSDTEPMTWTVYDDGTVTFSGSGMAPAPWSSEERSWLRAGVTITKVVVEPGITGIPTNFFVGFKDATEFVLPEGLTYIGPTAFYGCSKLVSITLPSTITFFSDSSFSLCWALKTVTIAPKEGYTFVGWADDSGHLYDTDANFVQGLINNEGFTPVWSRDWDNMFTDVADNAWYHDYVQYCYEAELMNGVSATEFSPTTYGTRAQVVTVLYRLSGDAAPAGNGGFSDVPTKQWYTAAVAWAKENGIATGYEDGTFRPNNDVTRQEFLTFLYRFTKARGQSVNDWSDYTLDNVTDQNNIQSWAWSAEVWSLATGIQAGYAIDGDEENIQVLPGSSIRRSEMAAFLARYAANLQDIYAIDLVESLYLKPVSYLSDYVQLFGTQKGSTNLGTEDGIVYRLQKFEFYNVITVQLEGDSTQYIYSLYWE
jgi:hypothetical protein